MKRVDDPPSKTLLRTLASFEDLRPRPARACTMAAAIAVFVFVCYALFNQPTEEDQTEPAAVASPRTPWSSRSANQSRKWTAYHASLVGDANAYESGKSSRLVLMGDSITEAWLGTGYGSPTPRAEGVPAVLNETLARHWPPTPLVLAISGDQTQHVLWRVAQGEVSKAMARQRGQKRRPSSGRAGRSRLAAPSCLRTVARWVPAQSCSCSRPAAQPWSLSEAPPKVADSNMLPASSKAHHLAPSRHANRSCSSRCSSAPTTLATATRPRRQARACWPSHAACSASRVASCSSTRCYRAATAACTHAYVCSM